VARALDQHAVAFAQYRGRRGHPVGFAAELYPELTALAGDEGARRIIARYPPFPVELDDAGILVDIDTEDDLTELRRTVGAAMRDPGAPAVAPH
jgi:molybdenum cofactor cytidylyltransferase